MITRAVIGLAALYGLRMLGMYLVMPVLSLYAGTLESATPLLIGMSLGIYGLSQAFLQIPFGAWSDKYGRRRVIVTGLLLFVLGSVICAQADSIWWLIIGRFFQGAGAIASALVALLADLTGPRYRARAMGAIGISVGVSFTIGMIFGPSLAVRLGVPVLFWVTAGLSIAGALFIVLFIPKVSAHHHHQDVEWTGGQTGMVLHHPALVRLDIGIFVLHTLVTALFVVGPTLLSQYVPQAEHGRIYAPIVLLGVPLLAASAYYSDRKGRLKEAIVAGAVCLVIGQVCLNFGDRSVLWVAGAVAGAVAGIAVAEPAMPALLTQITTADLRGTAAGIFHTGQFLGSFAGGLLGGAMLKAPHTFGPVLIVLSVIWLILSLGLPRHGIPPRRPVETFEASEPDAS